MERESPLEHHGHVGDRRAPVALSDVILEDRGETWLKLAIDVCIDVAPEAHMFDTSTKTHLWGTLCDTMSFPEFGRES